MDNFISSFCNNFYRTCLSLTSSPSSCSSPATRCTRATKAKRQATWRPIAILLCSYLLFWIWPLSWRSSFLSLFSFFSFFTDPCSSVTTNANELYRMHTEECLFNTLQKVLQSCADQCHAITERVFVFVLLERTLEEFILGSPVHWFFLS